MTAIGMVLIFGFLVAMVSAPVSAVVINFPDPGLEAAIRDEIGKQTGDIHDTDLTGLTSLDASERDIANLEGIQHCVDLTYLEMGYNQIHDITALSNLPLRRRLELNWLRGLG